MTTQPEPASLPEAFDPSWVLFHRSGVLIVNKPAGVPVHRGTKHGQGLAEMIDEWSRLNPGALEMRSGRSVHPVHRLDLEATGVLAFGLNPKAARELHAAFAGRTVKKIYLAVVAGPVAAVGHLRGRVGSRLRGRYRQLEAELTFRRLRGDDRLSLVEVEPEGGRPHQIRALFAASDRPLAGDLRYGKPKPARQFLEKFGVPFFLLHALELTLPEQIVGADRTFRAPLPEGFRNVIARKGWEPLPEMP